MPMNKIKIALALAMVMLLSACGKIVEVPPASVGKIITEHGYRDGIISTSKFRLDMCYWYCDRLAVLEVSDHTIKKPMKIFVPSDKLFLEFAVSATLSIDPNKSDDLFNTIQPRQVSNEIVLIPWDIVYETYADLIIKKIVQEHLTKFSISHIASNVEEMNIQLGAMLSKELKDKTPFLIRSMGIVDLDLPDTIIRAQIDAAERREQIQREEASLEVAVVRLERELSEAQLARQVELEKAETEALVHKTLSPVLSDRVLRLREMELHFSKWNGIYPETFVIGGEGDQNTMLQLGNKK